MLHIDGDEIPWPIIYNHQPGVEQLFFFGRSLDQDCNAEVTAVCCGSCVTAAQRPGFKEDVEITG